MTTHFYDFKQMKKKAKGTRNSVNNKIIMNY